MFDYRLAISCLQPWALALELGLTAEPGSEADGEAARIMVEGDRERDGACGIIDDLSCVHVGVVMVEQI